MVALPISPSAPATPLLAGPRHTLHSSGADDPFTRVVPDPPSDPLSDGPMAQLKLNVASLLDKPLFLQTKSREKKKNKIKYQ